MAMTTLAEHPAVKRFHERPASGRDTMASSTLEAQWLRRLCIAAGVDDAGWVEVGRPELADQRPEITSVFPATKTLISFLLKMNRENIRTPARSIANVEFHHTTDAINEVARRIVAALDEAGVRARNGAAAGFPMEADRWGAKMWTISHKPVAVAAGLGRMGIHRNVIHPKFGNFVLLGTVLMDAEVSQYSHPIDYNPCLECKLCVAACPTGAIGADGHFDFAACQTHNYREFMGGFNDWVERIADSRSARDYRQKVTGAETVSMWQSLSFGANYKAAYCMAVCPAGDDVIGPFLTDRKRFLEEVVDPLQEKSETVYVVANSDAEDHVGRRFPNKRTKRVSNGLAGQGSIRGFLRGLPLVFQRGKSQGLNAVYHFRFTGQEQLNATVTIRDRAIQVSEGHVGNGDVTITADSGTWLRVLRKEANLLWALVTRRIRIHGSPRLLLAFGRCFPS